MLAAAALTYALPFRQPDCNTTSHYALVQMLASGTRSIDSIHGQSCDISWSGGHFYSNKAPGLALVSVPWYALLRGFDALRPSRLAHASFPAAMRAIPRRNLWLLGLWGAWAMWRHSLERSRWFLGVATWAVITPFLMNTAGWLLTENGRQPWIVQGLMLVKNGVSPSVSVAWIWTTLIVFIVLYAALAAADGVLMVHYGRKNLAEGAEESPAAEGGGEDEAETETGVPVLTY